MKVQPNVRILGLREEKEQEKEEKNKTNKAPYTKNTNIMHIMQNYNNSLPTINFSIRHGACINMMKLQHKSIEILTMP